MSTEFIIVLIGAIIAVIGAAWFVIKTTKAMGDKWIEYRLLLAAFLVVVIASIFLCISKVVDPDWRQECFENFLSKDTVCSNCGENIGDDYAYCPSCGNDIAPTAPTCPNCHESCDTAYCRYCGFKNKED